MGESNTAEGLIEQLHLAPHPEGGWYCETWRGPDRADGRAGGTAIIFLLKSGERSHWHTVDAEEMWLWQAGDPLVLQIAESDEGPVEMITLGRDVGSGEALQGLVPTGAWQAAVPRAGIHGYSLVSCVVVPGFNFAGFTLAPPHWEPGKQP
ncbi:MAG: cupin domain-containing protein [Pseudomonadota bacterium]